VQVRGNCLKVCAPRATTAKGDEELVHNVRSVDADGTALVRQAYMPTQVTGVLA
jgi:hypothetical protein